MPESIAAGVLIASLLPRRPLRKAAKRGAALGDAFATTMAALGEQALNRAEDAGAGLQRGAKSAAGRSEDLSVNVVRYLGALVRGLLDQAEDVGEVAAEQAGKLGKTAAKRMTEASAAAEDAAVYAGKRIGKAAADARSRIIG